MIDALRNGPEPRILFIRDGRVVLWDGTVALLLEEWPYLGFIKDMQPDGAGGWKVSLSESSGAVTMKAYSRGQWVHRALWIFKILGLTGVLWWLGTCGGQL